MKFDPEKMLINMSSTLPEALDGAEHLCGLVTHFEGVNWHRELFFSEKEGGFIVYDWTIHELLSDCIIGWLKGVLTQAEVIEQHPEFIHARTKEEMN